MKFVQGPTLLVLCVSFFGAALSQRQPVGLDHEDTNSSPDHLIAALPWLVHCTAGSTQPCVVPPDAVNSIQSQLSSDAWSIICDLFPSLPWCPKKSTTTTRTTTKRQTTTRVNATIATRGPVSTQRDQNTTKKHHITTTPRHHPTSTSDSNSTTGTTHQWATTSTKHRSSVTSAPHNVTTSTEGRGNHTSAVSSMTTKKRVTTTKRTSTTSTVAPTTHDDFSIKWFFVGVAAMFGVALIILLIVLLCVRYRRGSASGGYSALGST